MAACRDRGLSPDVLGALAAGAGDETPAFGFARWRGGDHEVTRWSRDALLRAVRRAAGAIEAVTAPGDRVVVAAPPGFGFIAAFLGCLWSGRIAVPAQTPATARARAFVDRIVAVTQARLVIEAPLHDAARDAGPHDPVTPRRDAVAYLQFTSGSTQAPRGAVITHGALAANLAAIGDALDLGRTDRGVFWLPPFHDMGLVGALLTPIAFGFPATLMHPSAFLQRPGRWPALIAAERATFSGAPNFAYDLCVDRSDAADRARLDLSAWRVAVNGAEPVMARTLARFAEAYAPAGFNSAALAPGYGLAESVLFVTARRSGAGAGAVHAGVVSCGAPAPGTIVRIVDEARGVALPDGETGAVWVAGPSLAGGYWNDAAASTDAFGARLPGEPHAFLRTGDVGVLHGGELYICGRAKDVIVRAGRNVHAADLEHAIACALRGQGRTAAFPCLEAAEERLVIVHEAPAGADEGAVRAAIADALGAGFDIVPDVVALAAPGAVRVTSSGKVARAATRDAWRAGLLARPSLSTTEAHP